MFSQLFRDSIESPSDSRRDSDFTPKLRASHVDMRHDHRNTLHHASHSQHHVHHETHDSRPSHHHHHGSDSYQHPDHDHHPHDHHHHDHHHHDHHHHDHHPHDHHPHDHHPHDHHHHDLDHHHGSLSRHSHEHDHHHHHGQHGHPEGQMWSRGSRSFSMQMQDVLSKLSVLKSKSSHRIQSSSHVSPFVRNLMKKKFKTADRKREEELLNEMSEAKRLEYLSVTSHFTYEEVLSLAMMFHSMTKDSTPPLLMNRALFHEIFRLLFGITDNLMLDQIFYYFDQDREGTISETEWIKNLGVILRGTLEQQCEYCFCVYDLNGDKSLGKAETRALIQHTMGKQVLTDDAEAARDVADLAFRQLDPFGTGKITPQSFRQAVLRDPLLLQALGPCLPSAEKTELFLNMVVDDSKNYEAGYSLPGFPSYSYERERYEIQEIKEVQKHVASKNWRRAKLVKTASKLIS